MGMMINRRRACGGKKLPYDAEIEYLESSGTQYIDTGFAPTSLTEIEVSFIYSSQGRSDRYIYANWDTGSVVFAIDVLSQNLRIFKYTTDDRFTRGLSENVKHTIKVAHDSVIINEVSYGFTGGNFPSAMNSHMLLYGSAPSYLCSVKIYGAKRWENDVLFQDFIPVRVGQTGYMYDKVSGQLFGNAGTGDFILGADK